MSNQIFVSVIVPAHNSSRHLNQCLDSLTASSYKSYEIIVVDDGSTDNSAAVGRQKGAAVVHMERRSGPAAARNHGARRARGDILLFVDSDVIVRKDTVARVAADFVNDPDLAALFGSYDDDPAEKNFLSQYKNLYHHFVHQQSRRDAETFWAGCGAVRREAFDQVGGFDQSRYLKPSIEDIELGCRMRGAGLRIMFDKELQVKHLKQWRLGVLLRADILHRAVPWSRLILESRRMINDLNLKVFDRISAGLVGLSVALLPITIYTPLLIYAVALQLAAILILNHRLYAFFLRRRGLTFVALAFPMQLLYYFYSGVIFTLCYGTHLFLAKR